MEQFPNPIDFYADLERTALDGGFNPVYRAVRSGMGRYGCGGRADDASAFLDGTVLSTLSSAWSDDGCSQVGFYWYKLFLRI